MGHERKLRLERFGALCGNQRKQCPLRPLINIAHVSNDELHLE
ncbi:hypothetical protein ACVWXM_006311 [Bradyrhizobium sp. GM7.3]